MSGTTNVQCNGVCMYQTPRVDASSLHWKLQHSVQYFISLTNAQLICFKILKFALKYTINAPTCFGFD